MFDTKIYNTQQIDEHCLYLLERRITTENIFQKKKNDSNKAN